MKFYVQRAVLDAGVKILFAAVYGMDNHGEDPEWAAYRDQRLRDLYDEYAELDIHADPILEGFNLLGGNVCVKGLCDSTLQGDSVYRVIYPKIKAPGGTYDISDCPDLGPVLFALAAYYGGAVFEGTARLRIKESDRAKAMADELEKFGIAVEIFDNSVVIRKGELKAPQHPL